MDGYEKTPTLGLNKPEKGDFDWDLPLNENWDILDRVGGAQLPLLATIDLDYKLSGDAAIGWALAGSTLSGNTYTSLWAAMKVAYDRSVAADETHYGKTYSVKTDTVTGWRFVTMDVYNSALSALGESLGHVLDTNAKTIHLRASWYTYDLPTQDTRYIGYIWDETPPKVKGVLASVQYQSKNLLRYYKVGNTITNVENIDVGTILDSISDMVHASEFVETKRIVTATWRSGKNWYTKYSDGWIEQGGQTTGQATHTVTFPAPYTTTCNVIASTDSGVLSVQDVTTKQFNIYVYQPGKTPINYWYACGY